MLVYRHQIYLPTPVTLSTDGQPQGPHPHIHILPCPYYTTYRQASPVYSRGERGEDAVGGGLVGARPLSILHPSPYLKPLNLNAVHITPQHPPTTPPAPSPSHPPSQAQAPSQHAPYCFCLPPSHSSSHAHYLFHHVSSPITHWQVHHP